MLGHRKQQGQALVEFSLVLPVLTVLAIGSLLLGIYFTQRSTMTGITFIAAREAAVDPNAQAAAGRVRQRFASAAGWAGDTQVRASSDGHQVSVTMNHSGNMHMPLLANAGQAVAPGSRPLDQFADIQETVLMSSEVTSHNGSTRPRTSNIVDYRHKTSLQVAGVQLTPDLQRIPGMDRLLKQVAPQTDEMTSRQRDVAASGCAENTAAGACPAGAANPNIHGDTGFIKQMGYDPASGQVTGVPQQQTLVLLRDSRIAANLAKKSGFLAAAKVIDGSGTIATVMQGLKSVAQGVEGAFSGLSMATRAANDAAFSNPTVPLAQYQQGK